jgi:hypothetical protein
MLNPSKLLMISMGLFSFSFLLSIVMGDSFHASQVVMGLFASAAPILVSHLLDRARVQSDAKSQELDALKANIQSLEAEVSRINLALKLRN